MDVTTGTPKEEMDVGCLCRRPLGRPAAPCSTPSGFAFHGSWNRVPPTGYKVVYVPMDSIGDVAGEPVDVLAHIPPNAQWEDGFWPVDVAFDVCAGRLVVTSDGTAGGSGDKLVRLGSNLPTPESTTSEPAIFQA
jgi:hypothetical protein